ncbi:hypothetical protein QQY79_05475 [Flavobacterium tructae]|uniref:hypothetical protein n=1 Tax=Flavobacterium tructae TaxID=1114873 RepID=UPI002551F73A|nr:hypothetical protein [Flavobacterium tructae]MDL2141961.1 hypothetical protein [Flavobacterium tructae]
MPNIPPQTGQADITNLNTATQRTLIHIDLTQTFYSITPSELKIIEDGASSLWKDITLTGLGIGIPCCINSLIEFQKSKDFSSEIFWNGLIGGISITIAIIFAIVWYNFKNPCKDLIMEIKERPKYNM